MGSKAVREAHMLRYGAPQRSATPTSPSRLHDLARPKNRTISHQAMPGSETFISDANAGKSRMTHVFPRDEADESSDDDQDGPRFGVVTPQPAYPLDWRKVPLPSSHKALEWVYSSVSMERQQTVEQTVATAMRTIQRAIAPELAPTVVTRREARSLIRSPNRYAVLVDIVATKRRLLSGEPHDAAMQLYKRVEEAFPLIVSFMVVGITDNRAKRVARDVFNKDSVSGTKKLPFTSIDGQHMMIVHPQGTEGEIVKEQGRLVQAERDAARRARSCTPKFVPDSHQTHIAMSAAHNRSQSRGSALSKRAPGVDECNRCWRHNRPTSSYAPRASTPSESRFTDFPSRSDTATETSPSPSHGVPVSSPTVLLQKIRRSRNSTVLPVVAEETADQITVMKEIVSRISTVYS